MKIAASSYNFSRLIGKELQPLDIVVKTKEMGFDGLEFAGVSTVGDYNKLDSAKAFADECAKHNLTVTNYATGGEILRDFDNAVAYLKQEVLVAKALGATQMRHDVTWGETNGRYRSFAKHVGILAEGCRIVTEFAAEHGIKTTIENHGIYCQDSDRVEMLINEVDHPNYGALVDIGNFVCADEDPTLAVSRLHYYAFYAHVKDFFIRSGNTPFSTQGWYQTRAGNWILPTITGQGDVPVYQCLKVLARQKLEWISIEYEGPEHPMHCMPIALANTRNIIAAL